MTKSDMKRISDDFATAVIKLKNAGFDAVELHMGHGYLPSQYLSPRTNKRKDHYGGTIASRARFPLEVLNHIRDKAGSDFTVLIKINLSDGFRNGFNIEDCKNMAVELEKAACSALILSGEFTSITPFYLMRGEVPLLGMVRNGTNLMEKATMALWGPLIIKRYRFEPNFFLEQAKEIRKVTKMPLVDLGGVTSREGISEILDEGFDFIALGRPLIHDPDFLKKLEANEIEKTDCNRYNECIVEMDRGGVRCTIHD